MTQSYRPGLTHPAVSSHLPKLSAFEADGHIIRVTCTWCRRTHRYRPGDLMQLLGDVPFLYIEKQFRCSDCGKRDYMDARLEMPSAKERVGMRIRRLVEVRTVRQPIWEDVTL